MGLFRPPPSRWELLFDRLTKLALLPLKVAAVVGGLALGWLLVRFVWRCAHWLDRILDWVF